MKLTILSYKSIEDKAKQLFYQLQTFKKKEHLYKSVKQYFAGVEKKSNPRFTYTLQIKRGLDFIISIKPLRQIKIILF